MITFFTILFILIGLNAIMMVFSLKGTNQRTKKTTTNVSTASASKIYPLDLVSSEYKKAV